MTRWRGWWRWAPSTPRVVRSRRTAGFGTCLPIPTATSSVRCVRRRTWSGLDVQVRAGRWGGCPVWWAGVCARPPRDDQRLVETTEYRAAAAGRFGGVEPRRQARAFLLGLLSDVDARSCWQVAEQAGDATPHRMQLLLVEAVWDADKVRDDLRPVRGRRAGRSRPRC